jgi:hypothetical protein
MKFIFTNKRIDLSLSKDFQDLKVHNSENFSFLINDEATLTETGDLLSITNGYLRDTSRNKKSDQEKAAAVHVFDNWPVSDNITGSFSTLIYNKGKSESVITSDLCNIYPLYYLLHGDNYYFSNSIILLGRYSKAGLDKAGIFQRAVGPNFSNTGSRTILKDCKRLLPGEWIKINSQGKILEKKYDNSLYNNIGSISINKNDLNKYWNQYKKEVELCIRNYTEVNIALSGGVDSRVTLAAIPKTVNITARTFGNSSNYESRIAAKLANLKGANHSCYHDPQLYFPNKVVLQNYSLETEAVKLNSWLEILENINSIKKAPIFLGELCEGLPARNIKRFSSRKFRNKNFFKFYIKKNKFEFTNSSKTEFDRWKEFKTKNILSWHDSNWFQKLGFESLKNEIIDSTTADINEIFSRIEAHNLPYTELYDELFSWYTFTRMELSKQVNICNEKFYAFSPGMSTQMLRMTSNIHPNDRLYYRFANKLFKEIPDLKQFNKVPTSQIPFIPQNSSNIFKIPVWGIRSFMDDYLVKRLMKSKDRNKRYRLLKSINWIEVYQQKDMLKNIDDYYSSNELSHRYYKTFKNLAKKRQELINWPFANMDIISGAALNTEIDLIKNYPE